MQLNKTEFIGIQQVLRLVRQPEILQSEFDEILIDSERAQLPDNVIEKEVYIDLHNWLQACYDNYVMAQYLLTPEVTTVILPEDQSQVESLFDGVQIFEMRDQLKQELQAESLFDLDFDTKNVLNELFQMQNQLQHALDYLSLCPALSTEMIDSILHDLAFQKKADLKSHGWLSQVSKNQKDMAKALFLGDYKEEC